MFVFKLSFKLANRRKHEPCEDSAEQCQSQAAEPHGHANGCGHPDTGSSRQSLNFLRLAEFQNCAGANKTNARSKALDNSRYTVEIHAASCCRNYEECRSHRNQNMGPQPGGLAG